jgi:hypothetical protein
MKTAGYDIVLLVNERFLNELAGALFYSGFLTVNGSVDFYAGKLILEHKVKDYRQDLAQALAGKVATDLRSYLKMDFRFKLTQEPMIDFIQDANGQRIRLALGVRIYFWLWQGLEIKFDADISICAPLVFDAERNLKADLANADVETLALKYGRTMERPMKERLDGVVKAALQAYFENNAIVKRIELPSISVIIPEVTQYIPARNGTTPEELAIIPVSVDAVRVISPTLMAIGINLMGYRGGNPSALHDFARNCSVAVGVSEAAMHRVFSYVWRESQFAKRFGSNGGMWIFKNSDSFSVAQAGTFRVAKLDEFFSDISAGIGHFIQVAITKGLTLGFGEAVIEYRGIDFQYAMGVTLKNEPQFDLLGGNQVSIYNLAFDVYLELACHITVKTTVSADSSGFIPDEWTPWEDDVVLYTDTARLKLFDLGIHLKNLELRWGQGGLIWNEAKQTLELEIRGLDLYWNLGDVGSPLYGLPEALINWVSDQLEDEIVKRLPRIPLTPKMSFDLPLIPWPLKMSGRKLEITNSEAIVAADLEFEQLEKGSYPVPKYIVNINNGEIHKIGCDSVTDTYEVHQRAYHLLSEALAHGYDGCRNCLPAFHKR